ncbi:gp436 family protein [Chitinimonas sp.]|uniref:gp436 family protein n=1 Tax=Chitinimonas sp. TaxID=1934313 RepID=UPI0035B0D4BD
MAYASLARLIAALGETELIERTDRQGHGVIDQIILADAQGRADREIDGYCRGRYPVPFSPVPDDVADRAVDLTRFYLYSEGAPEWVREGYDAAVAWLAGVSAGRIQLPSVAPATATDNLAFFQADPRRGWAAT